MIIINNKLRTDLGYRIIIKYKEQPCFLKEKKRDFGIFRYILVSRFLILKVLGAPSKHSLWGKKNLSPYFRITRSWSVTSANTKSQTPVWLGHLVRFTSYLLLIDPVHCLGIWNPSTWPSIWISLAISLFCEFADQTGMPAGGFLRLRIKLWQKQWSLEVCVMIVVL